MGLLSLEQARGGPFVFTHEGASHVLPDPAEMDHTAILAAFRSEGRSLTQLRMPAWKAAKLLEAWARHHDLGLSSDVERLFYLLERYDKDIEVDLRAHAGGADLGQLWRSRRWRLLLNLIDHLPRHSYYSHAVAHDEEHAKLLAKAQAERAEQGEQKAPSPPLFQWTPEVNALADLIDAVHSMHHTLRLVNSDPKKKQPTPPAPYPRPQTAIQGATQRAKHEARRKRHEALVARVLPHKRAVKAPSTD